MSDSIYFGRSGTEPKLTGEVLAQRVASEVCIPISEEQGWRVWFWFPGRSYSATAHWWVREAGCTLIGEWVAPSDADGHDLHSTLAHDASRLSVYADDAWSTAMVLPKDFRATLIPRFAVGLAEASECGYAKIEEDMFGGSIWHRLDPAELAAKWMISQLVAELNQPEDFLRRLAAVFPIAEKIGWIAAWLNLYLPYITSEHRRD